MPVKGSSTRVSLTCPRCGTVFERMPHLAKTAIYCGVRCRGFQGVGRRFHGEAQHGNRAPEYDIWMSMRRRCLDPASKDYPRYGGRDIGLCDEWRDSYEAFVAAIGRRPGPGFSLDRIDNTAGYSPGNVRWATAKEQANNRRDTHLLTFEGETLPLTAWAVRVGLTYAALLQRIAKGWSVERALTTPLRVDRRRSD